MRHCLYLAVAVSYFATALSAQHRVDPRYTYHRVMAVMPLVGSGTHDDPIRPKYAPASQAGGQPGKGIIAFAYVPSDDGKHAIVEYVAIDRAALAEVLAEQGPGVLVFEKGRAKGQAIEAAIRQYRKDFSLDRFGVPIQ